jgi:hypothetical protein
MRMRAGTSHRALKVILEVTCIYVLYLGGPTTHLQKIIAPISIIGYDVTSDVVME